MPAEAAVAEELPEVAQHLRAMRSVCTKTRSTKSGPGRVRSSFGMPLDSWVSRLSASSPSSAWMSTSGSFTFGGPPAQRHGCRPA